MVRTWEEASHLARNKKNPEEKLGVFLEDIWNQNQIQEKDQIPVFLGQVYQQWEGGDYFLQPLKTIKSSELITPYNRAPLRAYLENHTNYSTGQTVICTVKLGRGSSPIEILKVDKIMSFNTKD